jgi:hypothetical protein
MSNESATDLFPNFIVRLPAVAIKAKAFLLAEEQEEARAKIAKIIDSIRCA